MDFLSVISKSQMQVCTVSRAYDIYKTSNLGIFKSRMPVWNISKECIN